jgi:hypothetical protein
VTLTPSRQGLSSSNLQPKKGDLNRGRKGWGVRRSTGALTLAQVTTKHSAPKGRIECGSMATSGAPRNPAVASGSAESSQEADPVNKKNQSSSSSIHQ